MTTREAYRQFPPVLLVSICAMPLVLLAGWNSWVPYSYWLDELFSVTTGLGTWRQLAHVVLGDVHPPLYQVLLKLWIGLIGDSEPRTRSLSLLAAITSMVMLIVGLRRRPISLLLPAVLLFGSAWLYSFYAQETRGYAVLLCFSVAATLLDVNRRSRPEDLGRFLWYAILLAMALTHYFGLIYAGVLLLADLSRMKEPRAIIERLFLGGLILLWPVIHYVLGSVSKKNGRPLLDYF